MAARDLYEKDFYKILGVSKNAPADEIKKKYRSLARELHPDKNKGDVKLEEQFKAVSEAYDILGDDKKRAEYDEARSLYEKGGMRAPMGGGNFQGGDFGDIFGGGNPQDIFTNLFGGGRRKRLAPRPASLRFEGGLDLLGHAGDSLGHFGRGLFRRQELAAQVFRVFFAVFEE